MLISLNPSVPDILVFVEEFNAGKEGISTPYSGVSNGSLNRGCHAGVYVFERISRRYQENNLSESAGTNTIAPGLIHKPKGAIGDFLLVTRAG